MLVLVAYDISSPRRLAKVARLMKNYGGRVQKSVFEGDISHEELEDLKMYLSEIELISSDSIRLYRLCGECIKKIQLYGQGEVTRDKDFYIV